MDTTSRFRIDVYEATQSQDVQPRDDSTLEPFAFQSHQLVEEDQKASGIDLRCLNGMRYGLSYAYMTYVEYNPDPANERITVQSSSYEVCIRGINLILLYEGLLDKKLLWIGEVNTQLLERYRELQPANDNIPDDIPVVIEIKVSRVE